MAQQSVARLHRAAHYDGTNGAAVVAEIPNASLTSGGAGNATLVLDIVGGGQHTVAPGRHIVWTEYPNTPAQVLDTALTSPQLAQVYGGLLGISDLDQVMADIAALQSFAGGAMKVQRGTGVTAANGTVTINWPVAFSTTPVVALGLETGSTAPHSARITSNSTTALGVHVLRAPVVTVLSINVLGATVDASGVTVHAVGIAPA